MEHFSDAVVAQPRMSSEYNQDDQEFYQGQYTANYAGYPQDGGQASGYDMGGTADFPQEQ